MSLAQRIASIFDKCQRSLAFHNTALNQLVDLLRREADQFQLTFWECLKPTLASYRGPPGLERLLIFIWRFLTWEPDAEVVAGGENPLAHARLAP